MANVQLNLYGSFLGYLGDGTLNLDKDTFRLTLHSTAYIPQSSHASFADVATSEISQANGYMSGGVQMTKALVKTGGGIRLTASPVSWTASGGDFNPSPAWGIISKVGAANGISNPLVCYFPVSPSSGTAVPVGQGKSLTFNFSQITGIVNIF